MSFPKNLVVSFSYTLVILNLFQDNAPPSIVILKQVQDDETEFG